MSYYDHTFRTNDCLYDHVFDVRSKSDLGYLRELHDKHFNEVIRKNVITCMPDGSRHKLPITTKGFIKN